MGMKQVKRPRGRPPSPGGPTPKADIQRRYRERLAAAGKIVRLVDASVLMAPDRDAFEAMSEELRHALSKISLLEEDRARWQKDCAHAEAELKAEERRHGNSIKQLVLLKQEIAALKAPAKRRKSDNALS